MANKMIKIVICMVVGWCCVQCVALAGTSIPGGMQKMCAEYVAVKYTDAYVKSLKGGNNDADYQRYIERFPSVDSWTIESNENFNSFFAWFSNPSNNFQGTYSKLTNFVRNRMVDDLDKLLELKTPEFKSACEEIMPKLKAEIEERIQPKPVVRQSPPKTNAVFQQQRNYGNTRRNDADGSTLLWIAIGIGVLNLVLMVFLFRDKQSKRDLREFIVGTIRGSETICKSDRVADYISGIVQQNVTPNGNNSKPNSDYSRVQQLEQKVISLERKIANLESSKSIGLRVESAPSQRQAVTPTVSVQTTVNPAPHVVEPVQQQPTATPAPKPEEPQTVCFVRNGGEGKLKKCGENVAQYKVLASKVGVAKFVFCGDLEKARSNSDATFDNVCQSEGNDIRDARKVETVTPGEVELLSDGNWRVVKKAVIKFS